MNNKNLLGKRINMLELQSKPPTTPLSIDLGNYLIMWFFRSSMYFGLSLQARENLNEKFTR